MLGVDDPSHRVLSDRGYFGIFLCGLHPEDVGSGEHPSLEEFRQTVRLLAIAGTDRLQELLRREAKKKEAGRGKEHNSSKCRAQFSKTIAPVPPTESARARLNNLEHAGTIDEAVSLSNHYISVQQYHDAYHVLFTYILHNPLDARVFEAATRVIVAASQFDREKGVAPFNMLYECEEMAAILAKRIPDLCRLMESGDERTEQLYRFVKTVYMTWTYHCRALLEYKYRASNTTWMRRSWIEPRDFGFLLDIMRMAIRSRLPLDLLRLVKTELKKCIVIGQNVIAHTDKRCKFEGDLLRILASPTKDVIPDLCFEYYCEIVNAYREQGDRATAMTFCRQALLIRKNDRDLLRIHEDLKRTLAGPRM